MQIFEGFKRKACVCVVSAEERRRRERRREDGIPEVSLDDLKVMQSECVQSLYLFCCRCCWFDYYCEQISVLLAVDEFS